MPAVVICASGPSLSPDDCSLAVESGLPVIAVNSTWRAVPACTHIYAGDLRWWDINFPNLPKSPARWTCNARAHKRYGLNLFPTNTGETFNSGLRAIRFAHWLGAENIILLGFDCSISNGSHWHGDHVALDNPTPANVMRWRGEFELLAQQMRGRVRIINSSRHSELQCFRRLSLDAALREVTC